MAHICHYLTALQNRDPERVLTVCGVRARTRREFALRTGALAAGLATLGVRRGDRVALIAQATDLFLEALLAISAVGAIAAPLNWRWSEDETRSAVRLIDARLLICDASCLHLRKCCQQSLVLGNNMLTASRDASTLAQDSTKPGQGGAGASEGAPLLAEDLIRAHHGVALSPVLPLDGSAIICFTSGTTGPAKGVVLSHAAFHTQALAKLLVVGYAEDDIYLHMAPLFHVGGLSSALAILLTGALQVFLPKFSATEALALVGKHKVSAFIAVPAILQDLLAAGEGRSFPSMRKLLLGGGEAAPDLLWRTRAAFPYADVQSAYGMTEACSSMTFRPLTRARLQTTARENPGGVCVGRPPPGIEMRIQVGLPFSCPFYLFFLYWNCPPSLLKCVFVCLFVCVCVCVCVCARARARVCACLYACGRRCTLGCGSGCFG
jgi:acyl-activating enzyme 14